MPDYSSSEATAMAAGASPDRSAWYRWRKELVGPIDYEQVVERIFNESGWSSRYLFMTITSAGIAVLGLLLSSPAHIDFDRRPIAIRAVVIVPRKSARDSAALQGDLARRLDQPVKLQLDQVLLDSSASSLDMQKVELRQASDASAAEAAADAAAARAVQLVALAAGFPRDSVVIDRDHRRATASASPLPDAGADTYRALERRAAEAAHGWQIAIVPPFADLPLIRFANNVDTLDLSAREAVLLAAPGLPAGDTPPTRPVLNQRRGLAVAALLRANGIATAPALPEGQAFTLRAAGQGSGR